jgi:hypothetical protein
MARPAFFPPMQDVVELGRRVSHEVLERSRQRLTGARRVFADARDTARDTVRETVHSARNHMQRAAMWRALRRRRRLK